MKISQDILHKIDKFYEMNRDEMVSDIINIVGIESISEDVGDPPFGTGCKQVLEEVLGIGRRLGFSCMNYDNYAGSISYLFGEEEIGIWGHLDTVPAGDGWSYEPFKATVVNNQIIGRGVIDDKGPSIAVIHALNCLKAIEYRPRHSVKVILGCNEEDGMKDISYYLGKEKPPKVSLVADSYFPVCMGEKGVIKAKITVPIGQTNILDFDAGVAGNIVPNCACVTLADIGYETELKRIAEEDCVLDVHDNHLKMSTDGIAAHAALPENGISAIYNLLDILSKYQLVKGAESKKFYSILDIAKEYTGAGLGIQIEDEDYGNLTMIIGQMKKKSDSLILDVNIRYPITTGFDYINNNMANAIAKYGWNYEITLHAPPYHIDKDDKILKKLADVYKDVFHATGKPCVSGAATYARFLPNAYGFGPEVYAKETFNRKSGGIHMPDESIGIDDLVRISKAYTLAIISLDAEL